MHIINMGDSKNLIKFDRNLMNKSLTPRMNRSGVILPSQQQSYALCVEFAKEWFLSKYKDNYFNSVYIDGSHSFDEFRKFSDITEKLKRTNPLLAIVPSIDMSYNRNWIDSTPEMPMLLRRSRIEGSFFNDIRDNRGLHLQIIFKTILMNYLFKIRLDTRSEQLDMVEFIKMHHRAGFTETVNLDLDVHVPKRIISQIAFDNGFDMDDKGNVKNKIEMLNYLNTYSLIPFIYKLRCATGNDEYFIKVPNCVAHIKSEMPSMDDGERQDMISTNYNIDFNVEIEMTAPYCYTYFSQKEHNFINKVPEHDDSIVAVMKSKMTEVPSEDKNHWGLLTTTEYIIDEDDLKKPLDIDFNELFINTDIGNVLEYTRHIAISPAIFLNFVMYNDGDPLKYTMDWNKLTAHIDSKITNQTIVIGIYANMKYVNDTIINIRELDTNPDRIH